MAEAAELDQLQQLLGARANLRFRRPLPATAHAEAEGDVIGDRHMPEQRIMLKDEAHLAVGDLEAGNVLTVEFDAAGVGKFQPRDDAQPRRFARPRRSEEHTSELQSLMRRPYAVYCLTNK